MTASVSPSVAGSSEATYTIGFVASSQGGLTAGVDAIDVGLPGLAGGAGGSTTVTDTTTGATGEIPNSSLGGSSTTPITINPGDHVTITSAATLTAPSTSARRP